MKRIAILAPSEEKLNKIRELLKDYDNELVFAIGSLSDGLAKVEELVKKGIEIIIARGETAFSIKAAYPDIVVVDVPISGFDLALALEETPNANTAYSLAAKNMGITISSVKRALSNRSTPVPIFCTADDPPFSRTLVAAYKKDRKLSIPARNLINMVKQTVTMHPYLKVPNFEVYRK